MDVIKKAPIIGRFWLLSGLGVLGAVGFMPSLTAGTGTPPSTTSLLQFVLAVSAICIAASWFGLRAADAAQLPMPYLRRLDARSEEIVVHLLIMSSVVRLTRGRVWSGILVAAIFSWRFM